MALRSRLGLAGLALLLLGAGRPPAATPVSRMDLPWWRERFEAKQAELRAHPPELIFLGDSITEDWEKAGPEPWRDFRPGWDRYYGGRHAVNLGFKGDATAHLLWRMEHGELDGVAPKLAVVLIGANNFGHLHWAAGPTLEGVDAILATLRRRLPETRALLLSVLPSERSPWISRQTAELNRALPAHARAAGAAFVDLTPVFAPGGRLDRSLYLDGKLTPPDPLLHPDAEGQARLAAAIEPEVARVLGPLP